MAHRFFCGQTIAIRSRLRPARGSGWRAGVWLCLATCLLTSPSGAFAGLPGSGAEAAQAPQASWGPCARIEEAESPTVGLVGAGLQVPVVGSAAVELAKGAFLVAGPDLLDPNFQHAVILLVEVGGNGAMGLIVNRPTGLPLAKAVPELEDLEDQAGKLFVGGPVEPWRVTWLLRSHTAPATARPVLQDVYLSADVDTLEQMLSSEDRNGSLRVYAGYAGWAPGQLEGELMRGDWHLLRGNSEAVFDKEPQELWPELSRGARGLWVESSPMPATALNNHGTNR